MGMTPISDARHRFPPDVVRHAVSLYLRFTLGDRDVEELLADSGLDVSYETIRRWVLEFGLQLLATCAPGDILRVELLPVSWTRNHLYRTVLMSRTSALV